MDAEEKNSRSRKIIHIDMDAFYASVEQRDHPELRGKPVIVGGDPHRRGVVAACSYEARRFGIHSAMAGKSAYHRCPQAVFLKPRFEVYRYVSRQIRDIFYSYTDLVEPLSLDEAFLDVTVNKKDIASATRIAQLIRKEIFQKTELTASAGVSCNKFLAKVASDENKPNGITVIPPDRADEFIDRLPIRKFHGVGKATEKRMRDLGIRTGKDLKAFRKEDLIRYFGKSGNYFYAIAHGQDERPVNPERIQKSLGKETTFDEDLADRDRMLEILTHIAERLEGLIQKNDIRGMTVTLKVKYADFQCITRSITDTEPVRDARRIMAHVRLLLENTEAGPRRVRLLGITISNFSDDTAPKKHRQLPLPFCLNFEQHPPRLRFSGPARIP